jgi:hypothetical protein
MASSRLRFPFDVVSCKGGSVNQLGGSACLRDDAMGTMKTNI